MSVRRAAKRAAQAIAAVAVFPCALLSGFGRVRPVYILFAQALALGPGFAGIFLRAAYYRMTLRECSIDISIHFGTVLVDPGAVVGPFVSVGSFCIIGKAMIGACTQISSGVQIPSGRHTHSRNAAGDLGGSLEEQTVIGAHCWIGASATVMAKVGDRSTIGAGAVVVKEIPPDSVAVGNPARVIQSVHAG